MIDQLRLGTIDTQFFYALRIPKYLWKDIHSLSKLA